MAAVTATAVPPLSGGCRHGSTAAHALIIADRLCRRAAWVPGAVAGSDTRLSVVWFHGSAVTARVSAARVTGREQAGQFGDRPVGGLEVAADVFRLLVPGLRHEHQEGSPLLSELGQGGVAVLVQVPAGPRPPYSGVLVEQGAGLAVGEAGQARARAHVARAGLTPASRTP